MLEVEGQQIGLSDRLGTNALPMESACDHEVDHQVHIVLK